MIGSFISYLVTFLPYFGDTVSLAISSIDSFFKSARMITAANYILRQFINNSDLDKNVGTIINILFKNKVFRQNLLEINRQQVNETNENKFEKLKRKFKEIQEWASKKLYSELYITTFEKRGYQDANLIIEYILGLKGQILYDFENLCVQDLYKNLNRLNNEYVDSREKVRCSSCLCNIY